MKNLSKIQHFNQSGEKLYILDTETTGLSNTAQIISLAYQEHSESVSEYEYFFALNEGVKIEAEAMAVHHITPTMLEKCHSLPSYAFDFSDGVVFAHNAKFDALKLKKEGVKIDKVVCTLEVARHLWSGLKKHQLQFLRYHFGLHEREATPIRPHEALSDVRVLAHLVEYMSEFITLDEMLRVSEGIITEEAKPRMLLMMPFGKHQGKKIEDLARDDRQYLEWLHKALTEKPEGRDDSLYFTISQHLQKLAI